VVKLHFNYKDVFRAGRLGFSAKKMWIQFLGFLLAYAGYTVLAYLSFMAGGLTIGSIWETYRLVPLYPTGLPWFSWVIWTVAAVWWVAIVLVFGVAISKVTYEQLKGDEFFEIKEAVKFAFSTGKSVVVAPFVLLLFVLFLVVMGLALSLVGSIPYFGELFFLIMAIPAFAVSLFIMYLFVVFIVSVVVGPAIVGTTKGDTFDTLFEAFSVLNDQPWRLVCYETLLLAVKALGVCILAYFSAKALVFAQTILGILMGSKLDDIFMNAFYYVKINIPAVYPEGLISWITLFLERIGMINLLYPPEYAAVDMHWAKTISAFGLGMIYYVLILFVMALGCSIFWAGNTVIFTVLVKKKDDKNLLEVRDEEPLPTEEKPDESKATVGEVKAKKTRVTSKKAKA